MIGTVTNDEGVMLRRILGALERNALERIHGGPCEGSLDGLREAIFVGRRVDLAAVLTKLTTEEMRALRAIFAHGRDDGGCRAP